MRKRLLAQREQFVSGAQAAVAATAVAHHMVAVLRQLEPQIIGLYWPYLREFNAVPALAADPALAKLPIALPFAQRSPVRMHYRAWDGKAPSVRDECNIPSSEGAPAAPDVVLVPCVGFTSSGLRIGYGGGYFDRWLAEHQGVTAVGIAWAVGEVDAAAFEAQAHDRALTLIVTENGVI